MNSYGLSKKIAKVLKKVCPAFWKTKNASGGPTSRSKCRAQDCKTNGELDTCTCVLWDKDKCLAGKWKCLAFIEEWKDEHIRPPSGKGTPTQAEYLAMAKAVCQRGG